LKPEVGGDMFLWNVGWRCYIPDDGIHPEANHKISAITDFCRKRKYIIPEGSSQTGARGSLVGWGTILQAVWSRVPFPIRSLDFSIDLVLPATLWPWGWLSLLTELTSWG
jgi:hypothetical protein